MPRFGCYSPDSAEKAKTALDRELAQVEFHLDRIAAAVPQAGATTARLDEAKDIARGVVDDLHDVITERTDSPGGPSAGGPVASVTALRVFGFDYWDEPGIGMEAA